MLMVSLLLYEQINDKQNVAAFSKMPESEMIVIVRFFCAIILHVTLTAELI